MPRPPFVGIKRSLLTFTFLSFGILNALAAGQNQLVSVNAAGTGASGVDNEIESNPSITPDGRYVVFDSTASNLVAGDANGVKDLFRRDLQTGTTAFISVNAAGTGSSNNLDPAAPPPDPHISANGNRVVFESDADNRATARLKIDLRCQR